MTDTPPADAVPQAQRALPIMINCDGMDIDERVTPDGQRLLFLKMYAGGGLVMATLPLDRAQAKQLAAELDKKAGPSLSAAQVADLPSKIVRP